MKHKTHSIFTKLILIVTIYSNFIESSTYKSYQIYGTEDCTMYFSFETTTTTECILHCGKDKCMNALHQNSSCSCVDDSCGSTQRDLGNRNDEKATIFECKILMSRFLSFICEEIFRCSLDIQFSVKKNPKFPKKEQHKYKDRRQIGEKFHLESLKCACFFDTVKF